MTGLVRSIDIDRIGLDPRIPRHATDPADLFCHVHAFLRAPGDLPPLMVGYAPGAGMYHIIGMQLTENIQQQAMMPWEVADAVQQFTLKKGCTQAEAAGLLAIDESVVSKAVTIANKLIAEYRPLLEAGEVRWSSAYLVATLPPELQRQVNPRKKRALLEKDIKILKGKPERKAKRVKHKDEFGLIEFRANTPREQIIDWLTKKIGELKKGLL